MEELLGLGASALSGGLFGLLGNVATKIFGFFERKQELAARREEWGHELSLQRLQMEARRAETEQELAIAQAQGSWSGLAASAQAEARVGRSYKWVDAVRALVRPALTVGLMGFLATAALVLEPGDIDRAFVVESLVFAAVTAIVWWFGDRAPKRAG